MERANEGVGCKVSKAITRTDVANEYLSMVESFKPPENKKAGPPPEATRLSLANQRQSDIA